MATFVKGELWDDGAGAAKILNTGFAEGRTIEVGRHDCLMRMRATITGTAPASVDLQVEYATPEAPTTFYVLDALPDDGALPGSDWVRDILLVPRFTYRFSAKRTGGDGTTALFLRGDLRDNTVAEGAAETKSTSAVSWIKSVLSSVYDSVLGVLRVVNLAGPETVLKGETLFDVTNVADGTYRYYVEHDGFSTFAMDLLLTPGGGGTITVTLEAAFQDDGLDIDARAYTDVTSIAFPPTVSWTSSSIILEHLGVLRDAKSFKWKVVIAGTGGVNVHRGFYKSSFGG